MRELVGRAGCVGAWVAWVEILRGLRRSIKFWRRSKNGVVGVGRSLGVGGVAPWNFGVGLRCFIEKTLLKITQNLQENIYAGVSSYINMQAEDLKKFIKKEISAYVYSCEFCEIFKGSYFVERLHTFDTVFFFRVNNLKGFQ